MKRKVDKRYVRPERQKVTGDGKMISLTKLVSTINNTLESRSEIYERDTGKKVNWTPVEYLKLLRAVYVLEDNIETYGLEKRKHIRPVKDESDGFVEYFLSLPAVSILLQPYNMYVRLEILEAIDDMLMQEQREYNGEVEVPVSEYIKISQHGMTTNYLYYIFPTDPNGKVHGIIQKIYQITDKDRSRRTATYNRWIMDFEKLKVPGQEYWEARGVDFSKPIHLRLGFVHMENYDLANLDKSLIDTYINEIRGVIKLDDKIVRKVTKESLGYCDSHQKGEMYIHISNFEPRTVND